MARLIKGMYYGSKLRPGSNLFGLRCGQMRGGSDRLIKNSGWYNRSGEKLGWGDLSAKDFRRIKRELKAGEFFVILGEVDSFWHFVTQFGAFGSLCKAEPEEKAPGVRYVEEHAAYIIARRRFYLVSRYDPNMKEIWEWRGLRFKVLKPDAVAALMIV